MLEKILFRIRDLFQEKIVFEKESSE